MGSQKQVGQSDRSAASLVGECAASIQKRSAGSGAPLALLPSSRRRFLQTAAAAASATILPGPLAAADDERPYHICAFEKFLQRLTYDELADAIAELGFVGIEATVRRGGHVKPERVEDDLPRLVEALGRRGLEVTIMASDVTRIDDPLSERVLRTAADLGVRRYRMGYYRYDLERDVPEQLAQLRPVVKDLAQANQQLGVAALYQNHAGPQNVGATLWDLYELIKDYPVSQIASAFDIRHAAVEAGMAWPAVYRLMRPHIGAVYVKDFVWNGSQVENVPLGTGRVDPKFFERVRQAHREQPISLHVEYLPRAGQQANVDALRNDLATLRRWLSA